MRDEALPAGGAFDGGVEAFANLELAAVVVFSFGSAAFALEGVDLLGLDLPLAAK